MLNFTTEKLGRKEYMEKYKIIFVYNAKSGKVNALFDIAHKLISPATYQCQLCAVTHDTFSENKLWKEFRMQTNLNLEFLHSDEFETKYRIKKYSYPIVLLQKSMELHEFISSEEIQKMKKTENLIEEVKRRITAFSNLY